MRKFVCIAGLPKDAVDEIQRRPVKRFTGDGTNPPIVFPLREPYAYRPGMSDPYLDRLSQRLQTVPHTQDAAILIAYVDYRGNETTRFVENFSPFALTAPIEPFYPDQPPRTERRSNLVRFVDDVAGIVDNLTERVRCVRDALSGANFSPLLLPVRNFHSPVVRQMIADLFNELGTAEDPRTMISGAVQEMLARHPIRKIIKKIGKHRQQYKYFEDDHRLRFKSPGRDRHGMARSGGDGHQPSCFLGSRVRFGGPFDPLFHYDCDYKRRALDNHYPNCHGANTAPNAVTHVNIAPNDAVR